MTDLNSAGQSRAKVRPIVGLGAGGHASVLVEILLGTHEHTVVGLLDFDGGKGKSVLGVPILGGDVLLPALKRQGVLHFFVGVGGTGDTEAHAFVYGLGQRAGLIPVSIFHPTAWRAPSARFGKGVILLAGAMVNTGAVIGENVLVNTGAIVEHDSVVERNAHVATGAILCGGVRVGEGAHIGAGAVVRQGIRIGPGALVGAGAVVVRDVPAKALVVGVPAQEQSRLPRVVRRGRNLP